jgi:hypothetical protein
VSDGAVDNPLSRCPRLASSPSRQVEEYLPQQILRR